jgi:uncharacterized membrane protein
LCCGLLCLVLAGLALACVATAMLLPYVADLMSLVGALLTMSISLVIPPLMHLAIVGHGAGELPWWVCALDAAVVCLGLTCAYVGATSAARSLIAKVTGAAAAVPL